MATATGASSVFWGENPRVTGREQGAAASEPPGDTGWRGRDRHTASPRSRSALLSPGCSFAKLFPILPLNA